MRGKAQDRTWHACPAGRAARRFTRVAAAFAAIAVVTAGCTQTTTSPPVPTREAAGIPANIPALPTKLPDNLAGGYNFVVGQYDFVLGLLKCFEPAGCFGDSKSTATITALKEISAQLDAIKADIASGIAATRLDLAESNYAQVEQEYTRKYGTHIATAYRALTQMSDPAITETLRRRAYRNFMAEAAALMPATAETAMYQYLTSMAGSGQGLTQAGILGAAWRLITAQTRQDQGDAKGSLPVYLPASAINLMADIGTLRLLEGAQLAVVLTAYSVISYPDDYESNPKEQDELRREIGALWINGIEDVPGAAAITASLPRSVPTQSGMLSGLGADANEALLVRNFGPVVDTGKQSGALVNADAGSSLTPGLDDWLWVSKFRNAPRRELTLSRAGLAWNYDEATGSLSATIAKTPIPSLSDEAGPIVAVHPKTLAAGEIVTFARAGTVADENTGWAFDEKTTRISPKGHGGLCMSLRSRGDSPGSSRTPRYDLDAPYEWTKGKNVQGWRFAYDKIGPLYDSIPSHQYISLIPLPRITLETCASTEMQQWFLSGPIPQDSLPFWTPNALIPVSPTNAEAVGQDDYPQEYWRVLTLQEVKDAFKLLAARGVSDATLFERYGSTRTQPIDRALPPVIHPIMESTSKAPFSFSVPEGKSMPSKPDYPIEGVAIPVVDGSKRGFALRPIHVSEAADSQMFFESATVPWMSTAAVLTMAVDPCTFTFMAPIGDSFDCEYKNRVKNEIAVEPVRLASTPKSSQSGNASPSAVAESVTPKPTGSDIGSAIPGTGEARDEDAQPSPARS